MTRRIRGHLSPPMLIAMVALFVSLTGAAVANLQIRDNTINTRDIKDNQVNTKDLRDGSVATMTSMTLSRTACRPVGC